MIPDGDRRHGTESSRVIDEVAPVGEWDQDVMSVLVGGEDGINVERRLLRATPIERALKRGLSSDGVRQFLPQRMRQPRVVDEWYRGH